MWALLNNQIRTMGVVVAATVILVAQSGCGSKIRALRSPSTNVDTPLPYVFLVDVDAQGGVDGSQTHLSGSFQVTNVAVSGNQDRAEATSAAFRVKGGIYVQ